MSATADPLSSVEIEAGIEGNHLRLILSGPERLEALLRLIDGARATLKLYFYMFRNDRSGRQVMERLIAALDRGVRVTLMIDSFGSAPMAPDFFGLFSDAGGCFGIFGARRSTRYLIRNHQKLAIADGTRLLLGGFNIADPYFKESGPDAWHDIALLLEGPRAAEADRWLDALQSWVTTGRQRFSRLRRMIRRWRSHESALTFLLGGPVRRLSPWAQAVKHDLERAARCDLVAAYFSPSRGMLRRIGRIGARGQARIITAAHSDNSTTIAAARFLYARLLRHDVRIHEYLPGKLHMKLAVIDDAVYVGSANFDMRSLFLNLEIMLRIRDAGFADQMRGFIARELADCQEITPELHRRRTGIFTRALGWISYAMVAVVDYTVTRRLNFPARVQPGED